jgi:hypothetical protein
MLNCCKLPEIVHYFHPNCDRHLGNLAHIETSITSGALAYYITRDYAAWCVAHVMDALDAISWQSVPPPANTLLLRAFMYVSGGSWVTAPLAVECESGVLTDHYRAIARAEDFCA